MSGDGIARACQASLARLGTDFVDLYLLHWPVPNSQFSKVVAGFEQLRGAVKMKAWGVSNFNVDQMENLFRIPDGNRCATNQVLTASTTEVLSVTFYGARSTIAGDGIFPSVARIALDNRPTPAQIGAAHGCSAAAVARPGLSAA